MLAFRVEFKGALVGSVARWPLGGIEKRIQGQLKPIDRRAVKVHKEYCKAAKDLESKYHHTPDNEIGPVKYALLSFRPVAGCFGELSAGFNGVCTFIERNRAVSYLDRYDDKSPKEALGMFRSRIRSHFCLERPNLGSQPQVRWPAVARRLRRTFG